MTGLELRKALVLSGTGVAKFADHVDHLFVSGDCSVDDVIAALEAAPRDLSATVTKAKSILAEHAVKEVVKEEVQEHEPPVVETPAPTAE